MESSAACTRSTASRVDHHARVSSSGSSPAPSVAGARRRERVAPERGQRGEERGEGSAARRRICAISLTAAGQEQNQARPQREEPHPQEAASPLRVPRARACRSRRRGRRVLGDTLNEKSDRQNAASRIAHANRHHGGQRVRRAAARVHPLAPARARAVQRRADPVPASSRPTISRVRPNGPSQSSIPPSSRPAWACIQGLRRQRVRLPHECGAPGPLLDRTITAAAGGERVGDDPVSDRDRHVELRVADRNSSADPSWFTERYMTLPAST